MRTATIHELKKEMSTLPVPVLVDACLRLAKYKKDNKELLTYLLFEAHDPAGYMDGVKAELRELFSALPSQEYLMKKSLRKILRMTNKYIRYAASKELEVELLLFFCAQVRYWKVPIDRSVQMSNLFMQQMKKIRLAISGLHEDLQYDYLKEVNALTQA